MQTPFRLDEHKRRPQPLASPPERYFDQLPARVMARVQPASAPGLAGSWGWFRQLSAPMRTALASVAVLGGFAASFWMSPAALAPAATPALAAVPQAEMVQYLLASDQRLTLSDLAEFSSAAPDMSGSYLQASASELQDALDEQPSEEPYY